MEVKKSGSISGKSSGHHGLNQTYTSEPEGVLFSHAQQPNDSTPL